MLKASAWRRLYLGGAVSIVLLLASSAKPAPKNFVPDFTFKGSSLTGWHPLGQASWQAQNGEIIATVKPGGSGGWLVSDTSFQDVQLSASLRCTGGCKTGVLFRAEKTADGGMKGVYVSLNDGDLTSYRVTLDGNGQELTRNRLRGGGGDTRFASAGSTLALTQGAGSAPGAAEAGGPGAEGRGAAGGRAGRGAAAGKGGGRGGRGAAALRTDDWNEVQFTLDVDVLRVSLNGGGGVAGGDVDDAAKGFGPMALYVGGAGQVQFKDIAWKDLRTKEIPAEHVSSRFTVQQLSPFSYTYSAAAADINRDGIPDIIAGPYYYLGPKYTSYREIYLAQTYSAGVLAPIFSRVQYGYDFTGDGWPDVVRIAPDDAVLYVNPKGESRRWDQYHVLNVSTEIALLRDIDGDGKPELVYGGGGIYAYANPDPANPTARWIIHPISGSVPVAGHGLGVGDINGDRRKDLVTPAGWYEQPAKGAAPGPWPFHPVDFSAGRGGGAEMCAYDVNGDGLSDVVTSLAGHGWGLAWYEQKKSADGTVSFVQHMIMDDFSTENAGNVTFSELHGSACADIDGDGIPDFITGKRYWSHLEGYSSPDPYGAPVLYVYKTKRNPKAPGGAEFVPELIDNRTGVGSTMVVEDLNKDGAIDIVTSTNLGTNIFWGKPAKGASALAKKAP